MIKKRKIAAITLSTMLAASVLTGCGTGVANSTTNETAQTESSAKTANVSDYKGSSFTGKVTAVDGNEITISVGGGPMGQRPDFNSEDGDKQTPPDFNNEDGNMPTPPDIDSEDGSKQAPPDFNSEDGNMPTPPDFDSEDGSKQAPPDFNNEDGNIPTPPDMNSDESKDQTSSDSNTDDSNRPAPPDKNSDDDKDSSSSDKANKKEHESQTITFTIDDESVLEDITMSDIAINSMLTVSVDDSGKISKITKSFANMKPDGKFERSDKDINTSDENTESDDKADDNESSGSDNGESSL